MKALVHWFQDRLGLRQADGCCTTVTPGGCPFRHVLSSAILFTFVTQVLTGLVLWMYYSPSAQTAWESVYFLQHEVCGGWLLRGIHHYAAQMLVALSVLYVLHLIVLGGYRAPREFVWYSALFMVLFALAGCITGDLLNGTENGFFATQTRVKFLQMLPVVGGSFYKLAVGGPEFGHLTYTRFFALHAGIFAPIFAGLLCFHARVQRRAWATLAAEKDCAVPFWPGQAVWNVLAGVAAVAVVLLLARGGVELGAPADAVAGYAPARPEWSLLGLYGLSEVFPKVEGLDILRAVPIFVIPSLLLLYFLFIPVLGRRPWGHLLNIFVVLLLLGINVGLTMHILRVDSADADHQAALAAGQVKAERVVELAQSPRGIPATGAITLLREDPKLQGPVLFARNCASCHPYSDPKTPIEVENPTAPDLYDFASRSWIAGFMDEDRIKSAEYFGNTKFVKDGSMAKFLRGDLEEVIEDLGEDEFETLLDALAAESKLDGPRPFDADEETIDGIDENTVFLFEDFTCTECHTFYHLGKPGGACDLTAYGSRDWLRGIIRDPTHERYYGDDNDRMPTYHKSPDDAIMSETQINVLVDWLRGEWYEKPE